MNEVIRLAIDAIAGWLKDYLGSIFGEWSLNILEVGTDFYNQFISSALDMLTSSPVYWNGGAGWSVVRTANAVFVALGCSLIVLFWMIGFCSESLDSHNNFRLENIIRSYLKILLAEFLVTQSMNIVQSFFGLVSYLAEGILPNSSSINMQISQEIRTCLESPGIGMGFVCLLFSIVFLISMTVCGMLIYVQSFTRFVKILIIIPYGALASSTAAGNHMLTHSAVSYYKYVLCCILEAVTMILALRIFSSVVGSGIVTIVSAATQGGAALAFIVQSILLSFVTLGVIKGSEQITQRALGL